jgi:3-oxoadipate enol-lactonase
MPPRPEPKTLRVTRAGHALHAEALPPRRQDAPWLVFCNSLVTDLTLWDAQAAALAGDYGVLRYDQAGHGRSEVPAGAMDFEGLGADLLAVMDAAGVARAVFVGVSMGVPTGLSAHRAAAGRFAGLVFSDGQARTAPGGAAGWAERIAGAEASGMAAFAEATAERWLTDGAGAATRDRLRAMIAATPLAGFRACATALMDYDYTDQLPRIACPTLLLAGAEDGAMPDSMAKILRPAIPGARMQVIEGAGHVPCLERPEAFTAALRGFLDTASERIAR